MSVDKPRAGWRERWLQGAPWWALPLVIPGVILGALGFVISVIWHEWWLSVTAVCLISMIVFFVAGATAEGFVFLALATLGAVQFARQR